MKEILSHGYCDKNRGADQGVVKEALVKAVKSENCLIALLNKLLGTEKDIREYLLINVVDTLFGGLPPYLLDLHYDV